MLKRDAETSSALGSCANPFAFDTSNALLSNATLEREIDFMVYELYGLSEEEIGIVEGS